MMDFSGSGKCTLKCATSGNVSYSWAVQTFFKTCVLAGLTQKSNIFILHLTESDIKIHQDEKVLNLKNFIPIYKIK